MLYRVFVKRLLTEANSRHKLELLHQQELLDQSIEVQEEERQRIALKIHDDIGNKLNVLAVWFQAPKFWENEQINEIINTYIPDLIETTRNISHSLYPVSLERFGLVVTLEELISNVPPILDIEFNLIHSYNGIHIAKELQLYRIIQEFLSNVIKHAEASRMCIYLRQTKNQFSIILSDNGKGFVYSTELRGMGLKNIGHRLNAIGANYKWKNSSKLGCRLIINIPNGEK